MWRSARRQLDPGGRQHGERRQKKDADLAQDVGGVIRQTREPGFISSAYFLRFKFEEGKYALVGREHARRPRRAEDRVLPGADVRRHRSPAQPGRDRRPPRTRRRDAEFQRLMNKVALVTLWVEPKAHQIVKYTFDNVGFDFLPVAVAGPHQRLQSDDDRGAAVSRRLAADRRSRSNLGDDRWRSARSTCATTSTTTTTACRASPAKSASSRCGRRWSWF